MRALIVTDMQGVITSHKDFSKVTTNINTIIKHFRDKGDLVVFTKHVSDDPEDFFYIEKKTTDIDNVLLDSKDLIIEKRTPSIFKDTKLEITLKEKGISEITLVGFNTEFCCLFSTISAYDRGFKVNFIEDAIGSCSDENTYEMPGLDINDFVGSCLDWSGVINVLYTEEFLEEA